MVQQSRIAMDALFGPTEGRNIARRSRRLFQNVPARIRDFEARFGEHAATSDFDYTADCPIFILSAGWRSGSTLLQRMIMARKQDVLIWGEPYDRARVFDRMMNQVRCFTRDWPWDDFIQPVVAGRDLSDQWIANFYPDPTHLKLAHRLFFDTLFAQPARRAGYHEWGVKEVRLTTRHVHYLRWLYPGAKFLLLYRNPLDAYRSYRERRRWFRAWPERPVLTPYAFGRNWTELTADFLRHQDESGVIVLRYEDLDTHETAQRISDYVGWSVELPSNMARVGSSRVGSQTIWAPRIERALLAFAVRKTARRAGYDF